MPAVRDAVAPGHATPLRPAAAGERAVLRRVLVAILLSSVCTLWVREAWALRTLQLAVFACAATVAALVAAKRRRAGGGWLLAPFLGMFAWGVLQLAARWSVVPADTEDAVLYWLTAGCMAWLGYQVSLSPDQRRRFLKAVLAGGSAVALLGILQLFTSPGRVFWLFDSGYDSQVIGPFVSPNNYAAFVELLLPLAILLALESRNRAHPYLVLAAALLASVVASGSRAGAILAIALSVAAFFLFRPSRRGGARSSRRWPLVNFALLAAVFTAIAGYEILWTKFSHDGDPFLVRRQFLTSSITMFRAQPLHGFGLGCWPSVYPQFAIIDIGATANHAHNEWIQWAAEGGWPALALMLAGVLGLAPRAVRSVWGIGLLAVSLHALVDYPFLRLGLSAWIFAFWGCLAATDAPSHATAADSRTPGRLLGSLLGAAAVPLLLWGMFSAAQWGWADHFSRRATPEGLKRAIALRPGKAEYYAALAGLEPRNEAPLLHAALARNAWLTQARIRLALQAEGRGELAESERQTLEATRHDRQFLPAWTAANFYFRQNREAEFWRWARTAAEMSHDEIGSLFDLCFRLTADASVVLQRVVGSKPALRRQYLAYLAGSGRLADAEGLALQIAMRAEAADRDALLSYVDAALAAGQPAAAVQVWDALSPPPNLLANGNFAHPVWNRGFDWRIPPTAGIESRQFGEGQPALRLDFSGNQPESCELLRHPLALKPGGLYVLRFQYRTSELPSQTGLSWVFDNQALDSQRACPLEASPAADAGSAAWRSAEWPFQAAHPLEYLTLQYRRLAGSSRIEGWFAMRRVSIEAAPAR